MDAGSLGADNFSLFHVPLTRHLVFCTSFFLSFTHVVSYRRCLVKISSDPHSRPPWTTPFFPPSFFVCPFSSLAFFFHFQLVSIFPGWSGVWTITCFSGYLIGELPTGRWSPPVIISFYAGKIGGFVCIKSFPSWFSLPLSDPPTGAPVLTFVPLPPIRCSCVTPPHFLPLSLCNTPPDYALARTNTPPPFLSSLFLFLQRGAVAPNSSISIFPCVPPPPHFYFGTSSLLH